MASLTVKIADKPFHEMGKSGSETVYTYDMLLRRREAKKEAVKREQSEACKRMRQLWSKEADRAKG